MPRFRLHDRLYPTLRPNQALSLYEQLERRLIPVLAAMESAGIRVDADELRRMSADFGARMAAMEIDAHKLASRPFGLGSPKQLGEVLFDELKLPGGKRTPSGAWGTDANVLQTLADQGHELPARVLEWRQLSKAEIAPMPTRWWRRSIRRPGGCTPATPWPPPAPAAFPATTRTCRTSRSAPRKARASAACLSPSPATC